MFTLTEESRRSHVDFIKIVNNVGGLSGNIRYPETVSSSHRNVPANEVREENYLDHKKEKNMRRLIYSGIFWAVRHSIPRGLDIMKKRLSILIWRLATDTCCRYGAVVRLLSKVELGLMLKLLRFMLVSSPEWVDRIVKPLKRLTKSEKPTEMEVGGGIFLSSTVEFKFGDICAVSL